MITRSHDDSGRVELLAPGGNEEAAKAAVLGGADAVYCGVKAFNARQRADNISMEQLRELILIAHQHDCRIYLTLNTLIVDDEVAEVLSLAAHAYAAGVDAIIVQDTGLLRLLTTYFPHIKIHASTQMTTHNDGQLKFCANAGVTQVNLCRELSLAEIRTLCSTARMLKLKTEVFVHGAYCISFSGQCYMSSVMSGKSGNRGECVQPCRRMYTCGKKKQNSLVLNLKDNSAFAYTKELAAAGVGTFKIEGRIKGYKYVYAVTSAWRRQLDRLHARKKIMHDDQSFHTVFNRLFSAGYLEGAVSGSMFVHTSRDQSLCYIASIRGYTADTGILKLDHEIHCNPEVPVLVYDEGFTFICTGFLIERTGHCSYRFKIDHKLKGRISTGQKLYQQAEYKNHEGLRKELAALHIIKQHIQMICSGANGMPMELCCIHKDKVVKVTSSVPLRSATKQPLSEEILKKKLGMLGDTAYVLRTIDCSNLEDGLFLPLKELNSMRRRAVSLLEQQYRTPTTAVSLPVVTKPVKVCTEKKTFLALLIDNEKDFKLKHVPETKLFFELPVHRVDYVKYFTDYFNAHSTVYP